MRSLLSRPIVISFSISLMCRCSAAYRAWVPRALNKVSRSDVGHRTSTVLKVIWYKAASAQQADGSVVFARLRKCAPYLVHPNRHPHRTGSAPCWVALSISTAGHIRPCLAPASFRPHDCPFTCGALDPHQIHDSLGPPKSISQMTSRSVQPLLQGWRSWQTDRQTDISRYSVCNNKPHLASAAMRPKIQKF